MAASSDFVPLDFVFPEIRRARLSELVQSFAQSYGIARRVKITPPRPVDIGPPPPIKVSWNNTESSFNVALDCWYGVTNAEHRADEESLSQALRVAVFARLGLRTLSADDKLRFLETISENRPQMPALWQHIDLSHQGKTELDKAEELVCLIAQDLTENAGQQGHLFDETSPWSEVVMRRERPFRNSDEVSKIMGYLIADFKKHGVPSQKILPEVNASYVPTWSLPPNYSNWTNELAQTQDGNYEGWVMEHLTDPTGEKYLAQLDITTAKNTLHKQSAFAGDTPFTRTPTQSPLRMAIAYADGKATCKLAMDEQQRLFSALKRRLPDGSTILPSSPWDANARFHGPIIPLPQNQNIASAFVLQRSTEAENAYFVHLAGDFDYVPQARSTLAASSNAHLAEDYYSLPPDKRKLSAPGSPSDWAEIVCDAQGRLIAQPHRLRQIEGAETQDFDLQLQELEEKIPNFFDPKALFQVGQPNTDYHGHIVASSPLFVLQAAYPPGQSKAVPVIHWRADFLSQTPHEQSALMPAQNEQGRYVSVSYAEDGKAQAVLKQAPVDLYPDPRRLAPEQGASSSAPSKAHDTAATHISAASPQEQAAAQTESFEHPSMDGKTVVHKPQPGMAREGWVVAQDAQHVYLQLTQSRRHVVAYPREAFAEKFLPEVDANTRIKIHYDGNMATATNRALSAPPSHARSSPHPAHQVSRRPSHGL